MIRILFHFLNGFYKRGTEPFKFHKRKIIDKLKKVSTNFSRGTLHHVDKKRSKKTLPVTCVHNALRYHAELLALKHIGNDIGWQHSILAESLYCLQSQFVVVSLFLVAIDKLQHKLILGYVWLFGMQAFLLSVRMWI
jgi:hypothetical protein